MRNPALVGIAMVTAITFSSPLAAQRLAPPPPPPMAAPHPGAPYPMPMPHPVPGGQGQWQGGGQWHGGQAHGSRGNRWGGRIGGHWSGGMNAPGGWHAYHRPSRGWALPPYWIAPSFFIDDFGAYGLAQPPQGYHWSRYYDDAVMVDGEGRVWDSMSGLDWDSGYGEGGYGYSETYREGGYPPPPMVYGGPAGPAGGTYTTTTTYAGGGYASGGYWYPPATTTTVVVQSAPIVTTTTTEYVDVVKTRAVRRVWRAPVRRWHPAPRCSCVRPVREKTIRGS